MTTDPALLAYWSTGVLYMLWVYDIRSASPPGNFLERLIVRILVIVVWPVDVLTRGIGKKR